MKLMSLTQKYLHTETKRFYASNFKDKNTFFFFLSFRRRKKNRMRVLKLINKNLNKQIMEIK